MALTKYKSTLDRNNILVIVENYPRMITIALMNNHPNVFSPL